jgi:hypothetical protein
MFTGLDPDVSKMSVLDVCMHVTTRAVNNGILLNFNQKCIEIMLGIMYVLFVAAVVYF